MATGPNQPEKQLTSIYRATRKGMPPEPTFQISLMKPFALSSQWGPPLITWALKKTFIESELKTWVQVRSTN